MEKFTSAIFFLTMDAVHGQNMIYNNHTHYITIIHFQVTLTTQKRPLRQSTVMAGSTQEILDIMMKMNISLLLID